MSIKLLITGIMATYKMKRKGKVLTLRFTVF